MRSLTSCEAAIEKQRYHTDATPQTTSLWRRIEITSLSDLDDLVLLLEICPDVAIHVQELSIRTDWKSAVFGWQWWKPRLCSDATEWIYADQTECAKIYGELYWDEEKMGRPYDGVEGIPDWFDGSEGPEGKGTMTTQPDIFATLALIERIIKAIAPVNQLQAFCWQTWHLPMSETVCSLLRDCESLRTFVIGPDGHHNTTSEFPT